MMVADELTARRNRRCVGCAACRFVDRFLSACVISQTSGSGNKWASRHGRREEVASQVTRREAAAAVAVAAAITQRKFPAAAWAARRLVWQLLWRPPAWSAGDTGGFLSFLAGWPAATTA